MTTPQLSKIIIGDTVLILADPDTMGAWQKSGLAFAKHAELTITRNWAAPDLDYIVIAHSVLWAMTVNDHESASPTDLDVK